MLKNFLTWDNWIATGIVDCLECLDKWIELFEFDCPLCLIGFFDELTARYSFPTSSFVTVCRYAYPISNRFYFAENDDNLVLDFDKFDYFDE